MSDFLAISTGPEIINRAEPTRPATSPASTPAATATPSARPADSVELSTHARLLSQLKELPDVRHELIQKTRDAVANGAYDDPRILDTALNAMIAEVDLIG